MSHQAPSSEATPGSLPELVQESHLETEIIDGCTTHSFYESEGDARTIKRQEKWYEVKHVGGGGFGQVFLQECRSEDEKGEDKKAEDKKGELRAVKQISLPKQRSSPMEYARELEALATFSQHKVFQRLNKL